jgi:hypothetical protein
MNKSPEIYWRDKSGIRHRFWIYRRGTKFNEPCPGIYIYARETSPHKWIPVYIGQTNSVNVRLTQREQRARLEKNGATHIHVSIVAEEKSRLRIEKSLIEQWKPACNELCTNTRGFDLIARELADANPTFGMRESNRGIYTAPYDAVNAILLKELVKEHRRMEEQETILARVQAIAAKQEMVIAELKSRMHALSDTVKKQAAQIQKANATFGMSRSSLQFGGNNH